MLWLLYEILFWFAVLISAPHYALRMRRRGGYASGFMERFGRYSPEKLKTLSKLKNPVWIHAVSVGEVNLALEFIAKLRETFPQLHLILSTTTSTGHALAIQKAPENCCVIYYPLDSRFCFQSLHRKVQVKALILMEAELWPNQLRYCARKNIPLVLINARISKKFYPRYHRFRKLFSEGFAGFKLVTTQSVADSKLLCDLGFPRSSIEEVGSLKYDYQPDSTSERRIKFLSDVASLKDQPLIIGGSTHAGEEELLLKSFLALKKSHPNLALGLAPRHVERTPDIERILQNHQCSYVKRSDLADKSASKADIIILNTTGELRYFYELASVIFIGKSLIGKGGQNVIEPACLGKAVLFGPHMENFEAITNDFVKSNAAIQIRGIDELQNTLQQLLEDPQLRTQLGTRAIELIRSKRGGMNRTISKVAPLIG